MEPESSLPHSQVHATCPYPEPARSSPHPHILKIHLNIIVPATPGSPKLSLSFRFPHQNSVYASPLPIRATFHAHLILLDFLPRTLLGERYITLYVLNVSEMNHNFEVTWGCRRIAVKFGMWHRTRRICPASLISVRTAVSDLAVDSDDVALSSIVFAAIHSLSSLLYGKYIIRVVQIPGTRSLGRVNFVQWAHGTDLASCRPSGA